jgi:hypothetical protein
MAREPSSSARELKSALELYSRREQSDLLEGVRLPDRNIEGNTIVVVSSTEIYSVRADDIIDDEDADRGFHRVWVRKGARVWHCQETTLKSKDVPRPGAADLEGVDDEGVSSRMLAFRAAPVIVPSEKERRVLEYYGREKYPEQLSWQLKQVFLTADNPLLSPLYKDWEELGLRVPKPKSAEAYLKTYTPKIHNLREFVATFG